MNFPIIELTPDSKKYPKLLKQISDPPDKLYCRGNINLLNTHCFSVVGTRKITSYGKEATDNIVSGLSATGWTIVSGLALGIDAAAHQAALDNDMLTIAVLGSTIDDSGIGPRTNLPLAKEILKNNGLLISEYKNSTDITKANFAVRDRIISGLSVGVLVVEGAEKSGSLITAKCAADQNRDVFAVPGSIFSFVSAGPNELIKKGARVVTSANDILEEYSQNLELELSAKGGPASGGKDNISTKDPVQKKILAILDDKGELTIDELIRESDIEASQILSAISMLEIKGRIKQRSGKYQKT
ncbi:MAG: DNA protecting protein DprA [Candidatus Yanofskybacteria bacterium RIFCSPHIGHO2_02_FULL_39_10]|uniref:DNA protecting protein DprA n=1 Tax=Candidatus Yanofskybacteria bacterium RIFCSPHIGHO2_02_FULL_39_10 TaxID=1802674 RepID=A0A1F8F9H4_9BACT|nr:MAG: DNA protecting protein DprA [Candidatus Yanofskybacteria bacterium RIFCSPHIGHO2_02_FULL_39_10]